MEKEGLYEMTKSLIKLPSEEFREMKAENVEQKAKIARQETEIAKQKAEIRRLQEMLRLMGNN